MKNLFLLIMSVFALNSIIAQQTSIVATQLVTTNDMYSTLEKPNKNVNTLILNSNYLNEADHKNISAIVNQLERKVANYDIKNSSVFDDTEEAIYPVVFKNNQGNLTVTYNNKGEIISSVERYKNIPIPVDLRVAISKEYPEWAFKNNSCLITYNPNNGFKKSYKIEIKKGDQIKSLSYNF